MPAVLESPPAGAIELGQVSATTCLNRLWDRRPGWDAALDSLKQEAARKGANGLTEVRYEEVPALETLVAWARELSPVDVVEQAPDALDLDRFGVEFDAQGGLDVDELAGHMRGATAVRGSMLTSADGARAVLRAGVSTVVRRPDQQEAVLLLQLVQARGQDDKEER